MNLLARTGRAAGAKNYPIQRYHLRDGFCGARAVVFKIFCRPSEKNQRCARHGIAGVSAYQVTGFVMINAEKNLCPLPAGHYETLEGLEQLRLLENGITVRP